jgi:fibronectin type 3 domain-containing protein
MKNLLKILSLWLVISITSCQKVLEIDSISQSKVFEQTKFAEPQKRFKNEIMVEWKDGKRSARSISKVNGRLKKSLRTKMMERTGAAGFDLIEVPSVTVAWDLLKNDPDVKMVSPNFIRRVPDIKPEPVVQNSLRTTEENFPNDPLLPELWGMSNINAKAAWDAGNRGDTSVIVGLSDEGIKYWHEDLRCVVWTNKFDPIDGIDNDGNGFVDDFWGWDFFNDDNTIFDNRDFHGTHVAGTIGGRGNNGKGVTGVAMQVKIISVKFLESFGDDFGAIRGYDYLADLKVRHSLRIVCTNNSWGGGGFNPFLYAAIQRQADVNIATICAAGNFQTDNDGPDPNYPSSYDLPNIIAVAASQWDNNLAGFSHWGDTSVDLAAPGTGIISCFQGELFQTNAYTGASGTSMASPHVAGAYAIYMAAHPNAHYTQAISDILGSVTIVPSLIGKVKSGGVLNLNSPVFKIPTQVQAEGGCLEQPDDLDSTAPTIPPDLEITGISAGQVSLKWREGSDDRPGQLTYIITTIGLGIDGTTDTTATLLNFQPGTYTWYVQARDSWGNMSNPTNTVSGTIPGDEIPPTAPEIYYTTSDTTSISAVFHPATDNIGVGHYKVYWQEAGAATWNTFNHTPYTYIFTINGLSPGRLYKVKMTTIDLTGNESVFSNQVTIGTQGSEETPPDTEAPSAPTGVNASNITTTSITVNWTGSTDNIGVTGYVVNWSGGQSVEVGSATSHVFNNLTPGTTYSFNVRARDAASNLSPASQTIQATTENIAQPPVCTPEPALAANQSALNVNLNWSVTGECEIQLIRIERKDGRAESTKPYATIANNPTNPYKDVCPGPGFYTYRLAVVVNGQTTYSDQVTIKASRK